MMLKLEEGHGGLLCTLTAVIADGGALRIGDIEKEENSLTPEMFGQAPAVRIVQAIKERVAEHTQNMLVLFRGHH
eukprot:1160334-Pelagomonas_calceolata.AAC.5